MQASNLFLLAETDHASRTLSLLSQTIRSALRRARTGRRRGGLTPPGEIGRGNERVLPDLTMCSLGILFVLADLPDPLQSDDLAESIYTPRQKTDREVRLLESRGFVQRVPNPTDMRQRSFIGLTDDGKALIRGITNTTDIERVKIRHKWKRNPLSDLEIEP